MADYGRVNTLDAQIAYAAIWGSPGSGASESSQFCTAASTLNWASCACPWRGDARSPDEMRRAGFTPALAVATGSIHGAAWSPDPRIPAQPASKQWPRVAAQA